MAYFTMKMKTQKKKVMKCSRMEKREKINDNVGGIRLHEVDQCCYLGNIITNEERKNSPKKETSSPVL